MTIESVVDADYANAVDARLNLYAAYIEYQIQEARRALPFLENFFEPRDARVLELARGVAVKELCTRSLACASLRSTSMRNRCNSARRMRARVTPRSDSWRGRENSWRFQPITLMRFARQCD